MSSSAFDQYDTATTTTSRVASEDLRRYDTHGADVQEQPHLDPSSTTSYSEPALPSPTSSPTTAASTSRPI